MDKKNIRVRFAPSPTGPLHIGGLRTAIYNYLFAKKHQGTFILRIEDTDQARLVPKSEDYIHRALDWMGITPQEGPVQGGAYGPYRQSERKALYRQYALELVKKGKAYYAFDTPESLEQMRTKLQATGKVASQYNALSRATMQNSLTLPQEEVNHRLKQGMPYVIRLRVEPKVSIRVKDMVRGWVRVKGDTLDDKVLLKQDGNATYHLANVVDDHLMHITHVIRGEEWLPSAPLHVLMYQYFGWQPPEFVHLPLILRGDGKGKLSKRSAVEAGMPIFPLNWQDPTTKKLLQGFCEAGYLPEALLNFLALLGWHPGGNKELFTREELIANFSLSRITKAGARFDIQKAQWCNAQYLRALPDKVLAARYLLPALVDKGIACKATYAVAVCGLVKERSVFPQDLVMQSSYFFQTPTFDASLLKDPGVLPSVCKVLDSWAPILEALSNFTTQHIKETLKQEIKHHNIKIGDVMRVLRLILTGQRVGPELMDILVVLGKKEVIKRIQVKY